MTQKFRNSKKSLANFTPTTVNRFIQRKYTRREFSCCLIVDLSLLCRITSRKVNRFITRKTLESKKELQNLAHNFVSEVHLKMKEYGLKNIYNYDQSGFQLKIHSGRTLADEGTKQVECLVQSVSAMTHSYTIQPTISAEGKLLSPLLIILKESSGRLGPIVEQTIFQPSNIFRSVSKSGKATSEHFKTWLQEVFFPNVGEKSVLLIDFWSGHCPRVVDGATPHNKEIVTMIIPKGTTENIQPLDVFGFKIWKNYVRHFSDSVMLLDYDLNLHLRNNIIKLQSLVHNQLSSPRYKNLFRYAWFKSGYIEERSEHFENPIEFAFGMSSQTQCEMKGCTNVAIIRCSCGIKSPCVSNIFSKNIITVQIMINK
ncbi:uncharacterized protein [Venturia canescens]|uniref:uncharacterized protein n=1 Tax=Venturia canescens TaxID=32260 RepID=UPI001C9C1870|nr:uncharacterized protein LOC122417276 [Venturia canescens]